jgi:hypothetical protein
MGTKEKLQQILSRKEKKKKEAAEQSRLISCAQWKATKSNHRLLILLHQGQVQRQPVCNKCFPLICVL